MPTDSTPTMATDAPWAPAVGASSPTISSSVNVSVPTPSRRRVNVPSGSGSSHDGSLLQQFERDAFAPGVGRPVSAKTHPLRPVRREAADRRALKTAREIGGKKNGQTCVSRPARTQPLLPGGPGRRLTGTSFTANRWAGRLDAK